MLKNEAAWLQRELARLPADALSPLLSIGSGTSETRRGRQPWIAELVFDPLERDGVQVIHHEHRAGPGVDVTGDLADPDFLASLPALGARSVLCANVLEHLADPKPVAEALASVVVPGGHLIATVPRRYPYHADPIDTMLRPSVDELADLFPSLELRSGEEVATGTLLSYAVSVRGKRTMVANGVRHAISRFKRADDGAPQPASPKTTASPQKSGESAIRYMFTPTSVTCAVLDRPV